MRPEPTWGPIGKEVFLGNCSRVKRDGQQESWRDTVERVVDGNLSFVDKKYAEDGEREKLFDYIYSFGLMPASRHLWATGIKTSQYINNCFTSGWGKNPSEHCCFMFERLMEGGGVGSNYSNSYIKKLGLVLSKPRIHFVCNPSHKDYKMLLNVLSDPILGGYSYEWAACDEIEDSREGWSRALRKVVDAFFSLHNSKDMVFDVSQIRPAGAIIKTFGGTASGPFALCKMLNNVADVLVKKYMKKLSSVDWMLVDHYISECVQAGGTRRAARIAIKHWEDDDIYDFITCKKDSSSHWTTNISVITDNNFYKQCKEGCLEANSLMDAICENAVKNGEPGFFNIDAAKEGEPDPEKIFSCNPCLAEGTDIVTKSGLRPIESEVTGDFTTLMWDGEQWVRTMVVSTGIKKVITLKFSNGSEITCTPDHRFELSSDKREVYAKDTLGRNLTWINTVPKLDKGLDQEYLDKVTLCGYLFTNADPTLSYCKSPADQNTKDLLYKFGADTDRETNNCLIGKELRSFSKDFIEQVPKGDRKIVHELIYADPEIVRAFLKGVFNSGATIYKDVVTYYHDSKDTLKDMCKMLSLFGIRGSVNFVAGQQNHKCGGRVWNSADKYRIYFDSVSAINFYNQIGFLDEERMSKLKEGIKKLKERPTSKVKVIEIVDEGKEVEVYDFMMEKTHWASVCGLKTHNCGELALHQYEQCCLAHINLAAEDFYKALVGCQESKKKLHEAARLITRFAMRATFADVADEKTKKVQEVNRRIGIGLMGYQNFLVKNGIKYSDGYKKKDVVDFFKELYGVVRKSADEFAFKMRIPSPVKVTTVAPTGTVGLFSGVQGGIQCLYAPYFLRTVTYSSLNKNHIKLIDQYKQEEGCVIEDSKTVPFGKIVKFYRRDPIVDEAAEEGLLEDISSLSIKDSFLTQLMFQQNWADNAISYTINFPADYITCFKEHATMKGFYVPDWEVDSMAREKSQEIKETVKGLFIKYGELLKGSTVMPDVSNRPQQPYTRITKEEYETRGGILGGAELECLNGVCGIAK